MQDYEVSGLDESYDLLMYYALFADCDPVAFDDVVKESIKMAESHG